MEDATEIKEPTIAPDAVVLEDDSELKILALEAEKAKVIEERDNYKTAYLKESTKHKSDQEESDDDRIRRITQETLADSRLADIAREQDEILRKALKENRELKLAQLNKTPVPPAAVGTHTESIAVQDTAVTQEQLAFFKSRNWSDKDIERYKANIRKRV